jgi:hypothetical protein
LNSGPGKILHQHGIEHQELTFRHSGIDRRLTDVHVEVIDDRLTLTGTIV